MRQNAWLGMEVVNMAKKLIASPEEAQGEIVIYQSEDGNSTCRKFRQVRTEGNRQVAREAHEKL